MRILVPVDGSDQSRHIIHYLGALQRLHEGDSPEIELVNVQYEPTPGLARVFGESAVKAAYEEEGQKVFEALRNTVEAAELTVKTKVVFGDMGPALAKEAERFGADLIVMGSRGLNPVKGFFLGSFTNAVLSQVKTPVLLVRKHTTVEKPALRIGVCVDGSVYGEAAVDHILKNHGVAGNDVRYELINVTEPFYIITDSSPDITDEIGSTSYAKAYEELAEKRFHETVDPIAAKFKEAGLAVDCVHLTGSVAEELVDYSMSLDLLVMGSHGRGNFTAAVLGSVAMHVAAETDLPILVVRR